MITRTNAGFSIISIKSFRTLATCVGLLLCHVFSWCQVGTVGVLSTRIVLATVEVISTITSCK